METKVLLRLIKDDIKILDEINRSFISHEKLSPDEVEVALARAKSLVKEFEILSRNVALSHEVMLKPESSIQTMAENNVTVKVKDAGMSETDSELIDLEEEEVSKPEAEEPIQQATAEEYALDGKSIQKEEAEKVSKPIKPAKLTVQGELFEEVEQNNTKTFGGKQQRVHDFLAKDHPEISFEEIPLKSIRDGIGINDRYLYTRELFGNEAEKFDETIAALDGFTHIEEAVGYLKQNFKWSKSEAGQKFLNLVKRRFRK
jgi:hypothetical protein